jgi:hypothetical protein
MNSNQRKFNLKSDVVFQPMDDSAIIVSLASEEIYKLNLTGTEIVKLVEQKKSVQEIISILEDSFEAPLSDLEKEVSQLLDELSSAGLIEEISGQ